MKEPLGEKLLEIALIVFICSLIVLYILGFIGAGIRLLVKEDEGKALKVYFAVIKVLSTVCQYSLFATLILVGIYFIAGILGWVPLPKWGEGSGYDYQN